MPCRAARVLGTSLISYVMAAGVSAAAAEEGRPESTPSIGILLTVASSLPDAARATFLDEVTTIWKGQGIAIEWLSPTEWLSPAANRRTRSGRLRVLVFPRRESSDSERNTLAVAELLRPKSGHAVAIAYIAAAKRIVDHAWLPRFRPFAAFDHSRLGLVLGRAVAHEIGHYLLDTHTHARRGLMRARFDAREFSDLRSNAFVLDRDAEEWLRGHVRNAPVPRVAELGSFSYAQ